MTDSSKESVADRKVWNSLKLCKLAATVLTPLTVLVLGCVIWSGQRDIVQRWEHVQVEQRVAAEAEARERERLRDVRFSIHREVAPLLNDIFSYHFYVGSWKELTPADIIAKKRQLDRSMYSNMALFTPAFFKLYHAFMAQSFRGAGNHLGESRIRSNIECRSPHLDNASEHWRSYFTHEDNRSNVCLAYATLIGRLSEELLRARDFTTSADAMGSRRVALLYQNRYKKID